MSHHQQGFTLIELLVVIVMIAVMSSLVLPHLSFSPKNAETGPLIELEKKLSKYRQKALSEDKPYHIVLTELGEAKVMSGEIFATTTFGLEEQDPVETFSMPPELNFATLHGKNTNTTFTFYPSGLSTAFIVYNADLALEYTGLAERAIIRPQRAGE